MTNVGKAIVLKTKLLTTRLSISAENGKTKSNQAVKQGRNYLCISRVDTTTSVCNSSQVPLVLYDLTYVYALGF